MAEYLCQHAQSKPYHVCLHNPIDLLTHRHRSMNPPSRLKRHPVMPEQVMSFS
ncbi:Uncharacterised protein [Vibrio cholerae]|nr:Uncharacterised protein [Vibrio cholerae]CSI43445.1 Uncharacterised protein [Vibrio cholerae]